MKVGRLVAGTLACVAAVAACAPVYHERSPSAALPPGPAGTAVAPAASRSDAGLVAVLERLVWPLATDRASILSSRYGDRRHPSGGDRRFHGGLDLRAPAGTPVYAAAAGTVVESGRRGAYGEVVVVRHGGDLESLYAHLERRLVRAGESVRRGQVVGLVGRTGNATGDHLHFELRWGDGYVDPWAVLPSLASVP